MRVQTEGQRARSRSREREQMLAELKKIDRRKRELRAAIQRLGDPADVDALVRLAEGGVDITSCEWAVIAEERPDAFNRLYDAKVAAR